MVSRAVLSTDYDGVSIFPKKNPRLYKKKGSKLAEKWIKCNDFFEYDLIVYNAK